MKQSKTDAEMTLADLQKLTFEDVNALTSFNKKMPRYTAFILISSVAFA
ncbi:hypothetical protein ACFGYG_04790 [Pasteurella multocida]|nr:hypothetical protein [Pasteurella multocida]HDR1874067.1 hypothetical protein [Pasteurella multocida]HDR1894427.1 hypothetical protein [Pasteurella multocida]HED4406676.1 hypothetical protein [Pasteurella multocida]